MFLERLTSSNGKFHPNPSLQFPIKTTSHQLSGPNQQTHSFKVRDMAMHFNSNIFLLAFFAITGILFPSDNNMVVGQGCEADVENLVNNCGRFVQRDKPRISPSPQCCNAVHKANIRCACSHVTNETVKLIDMDKVVFVAMSCGRPLTPGSCGGKKLFICEAFSGNELVD